MSGLERLIRRITIEDITTKINRMKVIRHTIQIQVVEEVEIFRPEIHIILILGTTKEIEDHRVDLKSNKLETHCNFSKLK